MQLAEKKIGVLCVDDNPHVAEALKLKLGRAGSFRWMGWLADADRMVETARSICPKIVILDVDMPGQDPFEATAELNQVCPDTRVVFFSGHVRADFIDRALDAGAWGYASKNDGEEELLAVLRAVAGGEMAFSPEARSTYDQG